MTDNQEREHLYHSSYVHEGFISFTDKNTFGLRIFYRFIFKDLESDCYCKSTISQ